MPPVRPIDRTKILVEAFAGLMGIDKPVNEKKAVSVDKNKLFNIESSA